MRAFRTALLGAVLAAGMLQTAQAQNTGAIPCGGYYSVVRGDTLREIGLRAYGFDNYRIILNANPNVLANENLIEIDDRLFIPCIDGSDPRAPQPDQARTPQAVSTPVVVTPTSGGATPSRQRLIKLLTAGDYAPFTDEDLPNGGLFTDLVRQAVENADRNRPYRITFVNDWGPHLDILLPEGAFDLGFPWFKPDCSKIDRLSDDMAARCTGYDFSDPFFEVMIGFYARRADPLASARSFTDLAGKTICRPRGYFTFDLEQENLKPPQVRMATPDTPEECFDMLAAGSVDVVSLNVLLSEKAIAERGLGADVTEISDLGGALTLHVLSPKSSPYGRSYLGLINRGLRALRESGTWFTTVSRHMTHHAKRTN